MQERAVAAVRIAAKVEPCCREIGGEAQHLDAGGTGGFFCEPELSVVSPEAREEVSCRSMGRMCSMVGIRSKKLIAT